MKKLSTIFLIFMLFINAVFSQPQLSFRFANPQCIEEYPQLFQFDVEIRANEAGTFLRDLQLYFDYSPMAFGSDIVANGKVILTNLDLLANNYVIVSLTDNTSSKFAAIIEATGEMNQTGSSGYFSEVGLNFTSLLRFQIEITDINETSGISFDQTLMNNGQYSQSTTSTTPLLYQYPCIFENSLTDLFIKGHKINLTTGWSGVSSYLNPLNDNVENLFDPIQEELIILQNFSGFYFPGENVNTLGNWDRTSGYIIKVNSNCQLKIMGSETDNNTLNLSVGWNLMPVLSSCDVNTSAVFTDILPNLIILKDVAGTGVFWPEHGINSIPLLNPGKAYFVKMAAAETICFPVCE